MVAAGLALASVVAAGAPAAGQDLGVPAPVLTGQAPRAFDTSAAAVTESMQRALARVQKAETEYYAANQRYAPSLADLNLEDAGETVVTIDSADDRGYHAVATSPALPGAEVELVGMAPPSGMLSGRRRRLTPADSSGSSGSAGSTGSAGGTGSTGESGAPPPAADSTAS
jgi:hypothetical protein